jgi:hypothetical protein
MTTLSISQGKIRKRSAPRSVSSRPYLSNFTDQSIRQGGLQKPCAQASFSAAQAIASMSRRYLVCAPVEFVLANPTTRSSKSYCPKLLTSNALFRRSKMLGNHFFYIKQCNNVVALGESTRDGVTVSMINDHYIMLDATFHLRFCLCD